jgi:nitrate/nitrite transporter NarK
MLCGFRAVTAFLTTYLVEQKSIGLGTAGAILSLLFGGGALAQASTGALADRGILDGSSYLVASQTALEGVVYTFLSERE